MEPITDFSRQIGFYLSGMGEVRAQLREAVGDLSNEEIATRLLPGTHSIGQLILHTAEADWWWLKCVVAEKDLDEAEAKREAFWDVLLDGDFAAKNYSAEFCVSAADRVREKCLRVLADLTDEDLDRSFGFDRRDGKRMECTLRWILHHLIDHEAQHKGQILMLKRLLREDREDL